MTNSEVVLLDGYQASANEKRLYGIKKAVLGLIAFVTTTLDELGVDRFHELTDPSLDELEDILNRLEEDASSCGDLNLRQAILFAQILIQDIKQKNPDLCANSARILKNTTIL